jgi:lysophospholipase L1-like esterase
MRHWIPGMAALILVSGLAAQGPGETQLADRLSQLMESTAVAVPGLVSASGSVRQLTASALGSMRAAPQDLSLQYRFAKLVAAYLALSDTFPHPQPFPQVAEQQFSELRESAQRFQVRFETALGQLDREAQARNADPSDLARYADANAKLPPPAAPRVVFFGDSITDAWRLNEYFTGRDFVNRGISGQTTLQMVGRFLQDVVALKPKAVLILAGTNDIAQGIRVSAIEDDLTAMGELAQSSGIKPVFASVLPVSDYHKDVDARFEVTKTRPPAVIRQINSWMQEYCRREGFTYVDYFTAMADGNGFMQADMADDGLHPNAKGYRVMAPIALDALNKTLSAVGSPATEKTQKKRFGLLGK